MYVYEITLILKSLTTVFQIQTHTKLLNLWEETKFIIDTTFKFLIFNIWFYEELLIVGISVIKKK